MKDSLEFLNICAGLQAKYFEYSQKNIAKLRKECIEKLKSGELFLLMEGERVVSGYFKKSDGEVGEVNIHMHVGMNQDSVLVRYGGVVDFRYFCTGCLIDEMKPYYWSESIDRVIIRNIGVRLKVISDENTLVCESCEEIVVERGDYFDHV